MVWTRTALAEKAAVVYGQGVAGRLEGEAKQVFRDLGQAIKYRLTGDRQAEEVLWDIEQTPLDDTFRKALAQELSYYAEVDPKFGDNLKLAVSRLPQSVK